MSTVDACAGSARGKTSRYHWVHASVPRIWISPPACGPNSRHPARQRRGESCTADRDHSGHASCAHMMQRTHATVIEKSPCVCYRLTCPSASYVVARAVSHPVGGHAVRAERPSAEGAPAWLPTADSQPGAGVVRARGVVVLGQPAAAPAGPHGRRTHCCGNQEPTHGPQCRFRGWWVPRQSSPCGFPPQVCAEGLHDCVWAYVCVFPPCTDGLCAIVCALAERG